MNGSQTQTDLQELNKSQEYISIGLDSISEERAKIRELLKTPADSTALKQKLNELSEKAGALKKEYNTRNYNFIKTHPQSFLSAYTLFFLSGYDVTTCKQLYYNLNPKVQISIWGKQVDQQIKSIEASVVGNKAFNFLTKDINGKTIELSQFKNKS